MSSALPVSTRLLVFLVFVTLILAPYSFSATTWNGVLRDAAGKPVADARIVLRGSPGERTYEARTTANGTFAFTGIEAGTYTLAVEAAGKSWAAAKPIVITEGNAPNLELTLSAKDETLGVVVTGQPQGTERKGSGGEHLSSAEVSNLPLNERDFSKLLLLAAGTMTDTNGAAGFTNVVTKSGTGQLHGSAFEFVRNAAFDARNFFDHASDLDPRRIPPFVRNEFGVTIGGPVVLPGIYDGRGKTFFFGEYAGFRQVLGTTQVFAVPTADERKGIDTTTFPKTSTSPGDTLFVPVSPEITSISARYPLPNDPTGAFGARTFAASSKVVTDTDQFSIRVDHKLSDKATLFTRFSLNNVNGPTTNPDQTAIDPSFAVKFFDHQRNAAVSYARTYSPQLSSTTLFDYVRSTPVFPSSNHSDIALAFGDGLFEAFNSADGSIFGSYGNVFQLKHDMSYVHRGHAFKWGVDIRWNRDTSVFGTNPSGVYSFGNGTTYSPVFIQSASGTHNILPGDPLSDSLLGLLTATPYEYTISGTYRLTPQGNR